MKTNEFDIQLLYSERQAAQSFVSAFPDRRFVCHSQQMFSNPEPVPNVTFTSEKAASQFTIPLYNESSWALDNAFSKASRLDFILPVSGVMPVGEWVAKGRFGHRPDAVMKASADEGDAAGVELYQPLEKSDAVFMVTGRFQKSSYQLGAFQIHRETFGWQDWIGAAESVKSNPLVESSLRILEATGYEGFFTINWIQAKGKMLATSFRPYPRALINSLKRAGVDVLDERADCGVCAEGVKSVFEIKYQRIGGM